MQLADARVSERPIFSERDRWSKSAFLQRRVCKTIGPASLPRLLVTMRQVITPVAAPGCTARECRAASACGVDRCRRRRPPQRRRAQMPADPRATSGWRPRKPSCVSRRRSSSLRPLASLAGARIKSRSNWARPPSTVSIGRPCEVVVSAHASPSEPKPACLLVIAASVLNTRRPQRVGCPAICCLALRSGVWCHRYNTALAGRSRSSWSRQRQPSAIPRAPPNPHRAGRRRRDSNEPLPTDRRSGLFAGS